MQKDDMTYDRAAIDALCNVGEQNSLRVEEIRKLLSAEPETAQWVQMHINPNLYKCSNCQVAWNKRFVFDNDGYSENIFMKYCPCCGRKMKTKVDYE